MAVVFFLFYGCHFDASTSTLEDSGNGDSTPDDCIAFAGAPCGDCGLSVCIEGPGGPQVLCEPDPAAPVCGNGLACNAEGLCQSQIACSSGLSRPCGECGSESCIGGIWSDECVADDDACGTGTRCLPDAMQGGAPQCQAACSTEGHQMPYDPSGTGLHTGGDPDPLGNIPIVSGPIPDVVPIGASWKSLEGCESDGGYKRCTCTYNYGGGNPGYPVVDCESFCRDED